MLAAQIADEDLVQLILLKKREGAELLYDLYSKALFLAILRFIPHREKAEVVLEKVYIQACNSIDLYLPQNGTLLAWLMAIARKLAKETYDGNKN